MIFYKPCNNFIPVFYFLGLEKAELKKNLSPKAKLKNPAGKEALVLENRNQNLHAIEVEINVEEEPLVLLAGIKFVCSFGKSLVSRTVEQFEKGHKKGNQYSIGRRFPITRSGFPYGKPSLEPSSGKPYPIKVNDFPFFKKTMLPE